MVGAEMERAINETYYASEKLEAKVVFPMGSDPFARKFARRMVRKKSNTNIYCAENPGDRYLFQNGKIKSLFSLMYE